MERVYYIYLAARKGAGGCFKGDCYNCPLTGCISYGSLKRIIIRDEAQQEFLQSQVYKLNKIERVTAYNEKNKQQR